MAPSDVGEKDRNMDAQLHSLRCRIATKLFGKFTAFMTFDAHKHVHSEPFLDYLYEVSASEMVFRFIELHYVG